MKVYKLDEYTHEITYLDIKDDIDVFYELLQCDCVDFGTFDSVPGLYRIVAIVDDVGAYTRVPTCCYASGIGLFYGSILFCRQYYDSPDLSDIEPEDLEIIQRCKI